VTVNLDTVVLGLITGLTYSTFALGLVVFYKAARFVNFAYGNLGLLASVLLAKLVIDAGVPFWLAFVICLSGCGALAAVVELGIVRRLFTAPRLVLTVATIAVSQILLFVATRPSLRAEQSKIVVEGYPTPLRTQWVVGDLVLRGPDILILLVVPLIGIAVAGFFRFTSYGQAVRAASENPDAARLAGISVKRMSTLVWVIGGVLAGITAILQAPRGSAFSPMAALGPGLLVRALAAGLVARMSSLPIAFVAGIVIGVVEAVIFDNFPSGGTTELFIFTTVMAALLLQARELSRASRDSSAAVVFGAEGRSLPARVASLPSVRALRFGTTGLVVVILVILPLLPILDLNTTSKTFLLVLVCGYAIVGLSLCLLTGWAGQVSLGQYAFVGVGSFAAARLAEAGLPWFLIPFAAGAVGAGVALAVGLPAVRIQGLFLAVSTIAFAVLASSWAFQQRWLVGDVGGAFLDRPSLLADERRLYWFGLLLVALFAAMVRNLRRSGPGRLLIAVRDNDRAARAHGVAATGARLVSFALAGFMAAVAGVLFAYARQRFQSTTFAPDTSFQMLSMVIIGGLGSIPGAILGAVFVFGLPALFSDSDIVALAVSGFGLLVFLLFVPQGLAGLLYSVRDVVVDRLDRRAQGLPPPPPVVPPLRELWDVAWGRTTTVAPEATSPPERVAAMEAGR
jgi:ABC-type branched-subunit amino acid transport system permease subunit